VKSVDEDAVAGGYGVAPRTEIIQDIEVWRSWSVENWRPSR
jgi:hypothetical protein